MGNWLEVALRRVAQEEAARNNQINEKAAVKNAELVQGLHDESVRKAAVAESFRIRLKPELSKLNPSELLTTVRNTVWKTGEIMYGEEISDVGGFVAFGLVHSYPAIFRYGRDFDHGMGDWIEFVTESTAIHDTYEALAVGASLDARQPDEIHYFVTSFSTEGFYGDNKNIRINRDGPPVSLKRPDNPECLLFKPKGHANFANTLGEIQRLLAEDCQKRILGGNTHLGVHQDKIINPILKGIIQRLVGK